MPTAPLKPQVQPGNATASPTTTPAQAYPTPELVQKVCPDSDGNNIRKYLPFILKAMAEGGMVSKNDLIGVLCTIYVETTPFAPIEEYGKGGGRHGIYYGRGFVQLTWKENYEKCGKAIGVDLVNSPALALKPDISAKALVWYFKTNGIPAYAARGDFDNVRSIVNSGSPGNIGICWGVDVYRGAVKRALQLFTQGIDPNAVGALPVDGSYGLGCADAGVGGSRTITQINPQNQGDALAHVLGLTNQLLGKAIEFRASLDAATDAAVLDLDAQKTFEAKGFGKGLDGTFTTDEVIFTLGDRLRVDVVAYQADPTAPQPQVFVHDTNQNNAPATATPAPAAAGDIPAKIYAAAIAARGKNTASGPDGGRNACAWSTNNFAVIPAGLKAIGSNPNYVPSCDDALKGGRGKVVSNSQAVPGDIVIANQQHHVGVYLGNGRVLSNSSSRAVFGWESNVDFDGYYGGSSVIYRVLN